MSYRTLNVALVVSAGLFTACASTNMQSVTRAPDFHSAAIHHVLVIGIIEDQAKRKNLEGEFVRQWSRRGVHAVSSLEILPTSTPLDKAGVAPLAKAQGFDAVLVTRLIAKQTVNPGELPVPATAAVNPATPASQNTNESSPSALQVLLAPPVYTNPYDLVTVETNLYDVASEQRVWSATSDTHVMGNVPKLIPPFVKLILQRLYQTP